MSDKRALIIFAAAFILQFVLPDDYAKHVFALVVFGLLYFLGTKIDELRQDLSESKKDIEELSETFRKRDLEEPLR